MDLVFRPAVKEDFDCFYWACFPYDRTSTQLRAIVEMEWNVFLDNRTTLSMIVEDLSLPPENTVVGLAQIVFVTDKFVEHVSSGAPPYAVHDASRSLPDGSWPLMEPDELRQANKVGGVNAFTTRWTSAREPLSDMEQRYVRDFMESVFPLFYRGYFYKSHLIGATGDWALNGLLSAGFELITDYARHYAEGPPVPSRARPSLLGLTRRRAIEREGTWACRLFTYAPPRFEFSPREQEVLFYALLGCPDEEIAALLSLGKDTIRRQWESAFDRFFPADAPKSSSDQVKSRGSAKRPVLLEYLRTHLEELRPTLMPQRWTPRYGASRPRRIASKRPQRRN